MEAVSPRPRKLSRLYSTEPRGLIMFFWMTLKGRRQSDCRQARQSHDAAGEAATQRRGFKTETVGQGIAFRLMDLH